MNIFLDAHLKLIRELLKNEVEFIIIGGYAVILHGYKRTTGDLDIWLKPDNNHKNNLVSALRSVGIQKQGLDELISIDFEKKVVFTIWEPPEQVDFLTHINNLEFEYASRRKILVKLDNLKVPFLNVQDLIVSKMSTDRYKDKADIEELQKIIRLKNLK